VVLHSYHHGFTWTDSLSEGIRSFFNEKAKEAEVRFEFLDSRFCASDAYLLQTRQALELKYIDRKVDVVITCDDHALNFMLKYGPAIFPGVPVVFCSVTGYTPEMRKQLQLTGLRESIDIRATVETALRLHPNTKQIAVIVDNSRTGAALKKKAAAVLDEYIGYIDVRYLEDMTVEQLKGELPKLSSNTILLLFIFKADETGRVLSHEQNLARIRPYSKAPIYAVWDFYLGHGIIGGHLSNGRQEGRMAAQLAFRILNGEKASQIALDESPVRYMFDYAELKRFGISLEKLPGNSLIVNKPFSLYEAYKTQFILAIAVLVGMSLIIIMLILNVTERKRAEKQLRDSEEDLRITINSIGDAVIATDKAGKIVRMNPVAEALTGWTIDQTQGRQLKEIFNIVNAKTKQAAKNPVAKVLKTGKIVGLANHTLLIAKDGAEYQIADSASPIYTADGNIAGVVLVFRDVTEDYRIQQNLRQSEERLSLALMGANDGVWDWDIVTNKVHFDKTYYTMAGYEPYEFPETFEEWEKRVHPDDIDSVKTTIGQCLAGQKTGFSAEFRFLRKSAEYMWIHAKGKITTYDNDGNPIRFIGTHSDITKRKIEEEEKRRLEAQLVKAQKMEAIGTLAGGIAHDFNNILGAIIGYTELGKIAAPEKSQLIENLNGILKASGRAKDLVHQILTFSRQADQEFKPVRIDLIVKEVLKLIRATLPSSIEIHQDLKSDRLVMADATQIHQIVMNLCTNSGHAMQEKGGVLEVTLVDAEFDSAVITMHPEIQPGHYLQLTVSDTGHGMPPGVLDRIFDPFFSTKGSGEGTGLGLAVVHGIVKSHNGAIYAYSEPEKGTIFRIYLPAIESQPGPEEKTPRALPKGSEHILYVDDEEVLTTVVGQMLETLGYKVTIRMSSREALELFKAHPERFDLVITDQTMPKMTGDQLAEEIIAIRSDTPIILCTGFSTKVTEEKARKIGIREFVMKPITMQDIAEAIRKALDQKNYSTQ
jgi:two-component system cell cycle sensor histidine kinase/response regulator CckA